MGQTKIEWCDKTWSPITGCNPISEGCAHCWAKRMANRLKGRYGYPKDDPFKVTFHPDRLNEPLHWKKPCRVFVCSMGDLFHDDMPSEIIQIVFDRMAFFDQHTYLLLTKRPRRMLDEILIWKDYCAEIGLPFPTPNIWLGVSVENQKTANERTSILLQIPAAKRFVSVEPMLGLVDLNEGPGGQLLGSCDLCHNQDPDCPGCNGQKGIDWIIAGGESGPGARPLHPWWVESLRDQCQSAGVPFFFKQMSGKQPIPKDLMIREFPREG